MSIHTTKQILEIHKLIVNDSLMEVNVKVDEREDIIKSITQYRHELIPDIIPLCSIVVSHRASSSISKEDFAIKIDEICKKFGAIIKSKSNYQESEKSHINQGFLRIQLLTGEFAIPFAGEVQKAIGNGDKVILRIPSKIVPLCLLNRQEVIETIEEWIQNQGLQLHTADFKYCGS